MATTGPVSVPKVYQFAALDPLKVVIGRGSKIEKESQPEPRGSPELGNFAQMHGKCAMLGKGLSPTEYHIGYAWPRLNRFPGY